MECQNHNVFGAKDYIDSKMYVQHQKMSSCLTTVSLPGTDVKRMKEERTSITHVAKNLATPSKFSVQTLLQ